MLAELRLNCADKQPVPAGFYDFSLLCAAYFKETPSFFLYTYPLFLATTGQLGRALGELAMNMYESGSTYGIMCADFSTNTICVDGSNLLPNYVVQSRLENMRSQKPRTTKTPEDGELFAIGGAGIRAIRSAMTALGGSLKYETSSRGIIRAILTVPELDKHLLAQ